MNDQQNRSADWLPCPAGEMSRVGHRVDAQRRAQQTRRLAGSGLAMVVLAGVLFTAVRFNQERENNFGNITCSQVQENVAAYMRGDLDPELRTRIEEHLAQCDKCKAWQKNMMKKQSKRTINSPRRLVQTSVPSASDVLVFDHEPSSESPRSNTVVANTVVATAYPRALLASSDR